MTPLSSFPARRRLLAVLAGSALLAACATTPTVSSRAVRPAPRLVSSLFVTTPPGLYVSDKAASMPGGVFLESLARSLTDQVSRRLNEAGNDTSTTLMPGPVGSVPDVIRERRQATGITHALVIYTQRASFAGGVPRSVLVEVKLYDATTLATLWEYRYEHRDAGGRAVPDIAQSLIAALRQDGFVR